MVNKEDFIMLNEFLLEEEFLFLEDIVVVQFIWLGRIDSIVKNKFVFDLNKFSFILNSIGSVY